MSRPLSLVLRGIAAGLVGLAGLYLLAAGFSGTAIGNYWPVGVVLSLGAIVLLGVKRRATWYLVGVVILAALTWIGIVIFYSSLT